MGTTVIAQDLSGLAFGRLTVIAEAAKRGRRRFWHCRCVCGRTKQIAQSMLRSGRTRSCGCLRTELTILRSTKHGACRQEARSRGYRAWQSMLDRCYTSSSTSYVRYGAVGVTVCARWRRSFNNFIADMGEPPIGYTLDRIDRKKGYSKSNCRWATPRDQAINRESTRLVTFQGETLCLKDWARRFEMSYLKLYKRVVYRGWTFERAVTEQ